MNLSTYPSCTEFANQFIERPVQTSLWSFSPDTVDEHAWCEANGSVYLSKYWASPALSEYGSVSTVADCEQCCLLDKYSNCSSIRFDTSCLLFLSPPPNAPEGTEQRCKYL